MHQHSRPEAGISLVVSRAQDSVHRLSLPNTPTMTNNKDLRMQDVHFAETSEGIFLKDCNFGFLSLQHDITIVCMKI